MVSIDLHKGADYLLEDNSHCARALHEPAAATSCTTRPTAAGKERRQDAELVAHHS